MDHDIPFGKLQKMWVWKGGDAMFVLFSVCFPFLGVAYEQALQTGQGGKRKESLQIHLWNLNSRSNSPVAPHQLRCQISANQGNAEMSANVNKHSKTHAKGNDVVVIFTNQHFASTFLMQIFKFQRNSCKFSFLFLPRPGEFAHRLL